MFTADAQTLQRTLGRIRQQKEEEVKLRQGQTVKLRKEETPQKGETMSSLSNQQPSSPFSEYSELCNVPSSLPTVPAQTWDWQHPTSVEIGTPSGLVVNVGSHATTGFTVEDKLCFFEQPERGSMELKVSGKVGGVSGSPSLCNVSLGSVGETPDSFLSSPLSPSPASPGRLPSALACGSASMVSLEHPTSAKLPHSIGALQMAACPTNVESLSEAQNNSSFGGSSPKVAMPQVAPNYCVIGVINENHVEKSDEVITRASAAIRTGDCSVGSSGGDSEEEEMEKEELDLERCCVGRAQQQRKAMRRAMSECSHLSVPTSLELPDKYPSGNGAGLDQPVSSIGGPYRSSHSMRRSLTVTEGQPSSPPPTVPAAGATQIDQQQVPLEPCLHIAPFLPLKDDKADSPLSSPVDSLESLTTGKELGGIVLPVPPIPKRFISMDINPAISAGSNIDEENDTDRDTAMFHHSSDNIMTNTGAGVVLNFEGDTSSMVGGNSDDYLATSGFTNPDLKLCSNPFITENGRWRFAVLNFYILQAEI